MALAYSVRFTRWIPGGTRLGFNAADLSSSVSMAEARRSRVGWSGRLAPYGGIIPARIRRTAFSHVSAASPALAISSLSSATPPDFRRWLWHPAQYWSTKAFGFV